MANGALTEVNQNVNQQVRKKNQSAKVKSKTISVGSNVDKLDQKVFKNEKKLSKAAENIEVAEKENTPILRRSKRRAAAPSTMKADLPVASKTKRSNIRASQNVKPKSKIALELMKENSITVTKDTDKIRNSSDLSPVISESKDVFKSGLSENSNSSPLNKTDDSGFESSTRVSDQSESKLDLLTQNSKNVAVHNEACILTSDTPPLRYLLELAEQRRKSLEIALQENESLHDQLAVLQAENSQLKELVREAEEFAETVKGMII